MAIIAFFELGDDVTDILEVLQDATMDDLLLERAVEAFGDTVGLGLGNKGEAGGHAPEPDLVEEVVRGVLGAVVHARVRPRPASAPVAANSDWSPWAIGSKAAKRLPIFTAWMPTQQASK